MTSAYTVMTPLVFLCSLDAKKEIADEAKKTLRHDLHAAATVPFAVVCLKLFYGRN